VLANVRGRIASRFSSSARGAIKEKAKDEVKEKAAGTAVKAVATKVGLASTGVGAVVLAGQLLVKAVTSDKVRDLGAAASILAFKFFSFLSAHLVASGFGLIGGLAGSLFGGPLGFMAGFSGGFMIGLQVEGAINSLGTLAGNFMTSLGSLSFAGVGSSFAAFFGAGFAPVLLAVGGTAVGTLFIVITTVAAFVQPPAAAHVDQEIKVDFRASKTAESAAFPAYTVGPQQISYKIDLTAYEDITIISVTDKMKRFGKTDPSDGFTVFENKSLLDTGPKSLVSGEVLPLTESYTASGIDFKDTTLVNTVTVTATVNGETKTETAVEIVTLGNPPSDQPYGYPMAGTIQDVDNQIIKGTGGKYYAHCGTFLFGPALLGAGNDRSCLQGGLDVSGSGVAVKSTLDGIVVKADFDKGNGSTTSSDGKPCLHVSSDITCLALGGYVYIQDVSKKYTVAYLHLGNPEVGPGDKVVRGQTIGTTHTSPLPTTTGSHVHYQVTIGGNNWPFANSFGSCQQGKLLPTKPSVGKSVSGSEVAPPCN
jgi:hypothetical protein